MSLNRDWGLYARMGGVFVVLIALYVGFGAVLAHFSGQFLAVAVVIGLLSLTQLFWGHKIALKGMRARPVEADEYPDLHARVERLAQQAGLPKPEVAVANTKMPNAFAAGRSQNTAVVCVTEGLLDTIEKDELDAVIAHELAHIKHRDMMIMTTASAIMAIAHVFVRWGWLMDDGGADGGDSPHLLIVLLSSVVVWVVSFLALRLLSRYREYAADRGAAAITGDPTAMATALKKIDSEMTNVPDEDLRENAGVSALFITPIEADMLTRWFRTHPSTEKRVERLEQMVEDFHSD